MSETAETERTIGKHEAEGLRILNEIEAPSHRTATSYVACRFVGNPHFYHLYSWSGAADGWRRLTSDDVNYSRTAAIERLARHVETADVAVIDEPIDLEDLSRDELDEVLGVSYTLMSPEGRPGLADGWTSIGIDRHGRGSHIHAGGRFARTSLKQRFLQEAQAQTRSILVRHDRAARSVVDKASWGIVGRPDLLGRQQDECLARDAQDKIDAERAWKEDGVPLARVPEYRARRQALGTW